jgi:hypothetical protein
VGRQGRPDESSIGATAYQDLKTANMQLKTKLKKLDDIGAFLSLADEAVRMAASLAPPSADA